jgi:hypothetical protein
MFLSKKVTYKIPRDIIELSPYLRRTLKNSFPVSKYGIV